MVGTLVMSLDFELMWGVHDSKTVEDYGPNILGVRRAIPEMLDLFSSSEFRATWATVGMLFCEDRDELEASLPDLRPSYINTKRSNYLYMPFVGKDEKSDPYHFGASLIGMIRSYGEGQEIGSHTFSHYYCDEPGQSLEQFEADISAAIKIATRKNVKLSSFVFPRNQCSAEYVRCLYRLGFKVFRGNERSWLFDNSVKDQSAKSAQRLGRLFDTYVNFSGSNAALPSKENGLVNIPSSRFLRPYSRKLRKFEPLRLDRIKSAMTDAALSGRIFHLWWHPHNFGVNIDENLHCLNTVLSHFHFLSDKYGMVSKNMGDFG
jgi:peptidoglycan/xylan/chitin deacetylase (PgdA/CDA1 family)